MQETTYVMTLDGEEIHLHDDEVITDDTLDELTGGKGDDEA